MHTLYARLRDDLRTRILDGRLPPEARLPSESELTEAHGVSRITVRQALSDLQREGLIVRVQGKGAFVAPPRAQQSLQRLQGLGEALGPQGQVHSRRLAAKQQRAPAEVAEALGLPARSPVWQLTSLRYLAREPLSVNVAWFARALGERIARLDLSGRDYIDVLEAELRTPVSRAELEIRAVPASPREARLLKIDPAAPTLQVRRVLRGVQDEPLQLEIATHHGERFAYKLGLVR